MVYFWLTVWLWLQAREIPGIKIFRYEGSLFFANQKQYFDQLYTKTGCNAVKLLFAQNKVELKKKRAEKKMELQMKTKSKVVFEIVADAVQLSERIWYAANTFTCLPLCQSWIIIPHAQDSCILHSRNLSCSQCLHFWLTVIAVTVYAGRCWW